MKKLFILFACTIAAASCTDNFGFQIVAPEGAVQGESVSFSADVSDAPTKTAFVGGGELYSVVWQSSDQINVNGRTLSLETEDQPAGYGPGYTRGQFSGPAPVANATSPCYKAIYPATLRDRWGYFNLPAEQQYSAGQPTEFPMYAESDDQSLSFRNLCGIIRLALKGDKSVTAITLADKDPEEPKALSGRFSVVSNTAVMAAGTAGTSLLCPTPVALNTETFTDFFITVPAETYGKLRIIVEATDGTICTLTSKAAITVERSMIRDIEISSPTFKDESAKITYTTSNTTKMAKYDGGADASVFGDGLSVVSHSYDAETKTGIITFSGTVTKVGYYAFRAISNLVAMTIPSTVTEIGERAFEGCGNFTTLNFPRGLVTIADYAFVNSVKFVPEDLSHISTIGTGAFQNTGISGTLTIGENITSLGTDAFRAVSGITEVVWNHTPQTLGGGIFYGCSNLASVTISDELSIPGYMFFNCDRLTSISFDAEVSSIGDNAFNSCDRLAGIDVPATVTSIGANAFSNCVALTEIILPESVVSLGKEAFSGCKALARVTFPTSASFTTVPDGCFKECTALVSAPIPSNITTVRQYAFQSCGFTSMPEGWGRSGLTYETHVFRYCPIESITFPDHWTSVPANFCWDWRSLTEVHFGAGVTTIGGSAFRDCKALTDGSRIVVPDRVISVGSYCFYGSGLTSLPSGINNPNITLSDNVFANTPLVSADVSQWTTIPASCFGSCKSLVSVVWGSSLTTIQNNAFLDCTSLASISDFPASLTAVQTNAFRNTALTDIPGGLRDDITYGDSVFYGTKITSLTLPDGFTRIPNGMFNSCTLLEELDLNDVTYLGQLAFSGCSALATVSAPLVETLSYCSFYRNASLVSISLPSIVTFSSGIYTGIINECHALRTIDLGENLQNLSSNCFYYDENLETLIIRRPDAVVTLNTTLNNRSGNPVPQIYVPAALVDSYKETAPWSNYADYIRSLDEL